MIHHCPARGQEMVTLCQGWPEQLWQGYLWLMDIWTFPQMTMKSCLVSHSTEAAPCFHPKELFECLLHQSQRMTVKSMASSCPCGVLRCLIEMCLCPVWAHQTPSRAHAQPQSRDMMFLPLPSPKLAAHPTHCMDSSRELGFPGSL